MKKGAIGTSRTVLLAAILVTHSSFLIPRPCFAQVITTVAGGARTFAGEGGPATIASLANPQAVAVDRLGNLYAPDNANHIVIKVSPDGTLTVVAGNGIRGYSGEGGPATSASLSAPAGVALDAAGNLYIADELNALIRRVSTDGTIVTVAGTGTGGFSGDGGPATRAALKRPRGVTVDAAGNLYIADWDNDRVRKVTPGGTITTVAGNGVRGYSDDGGPATDAALYLPTGVTVDSTGNLFIADTFNHRIRKVSPAGIISTVAGRGGGGSSGDFGPTTSASLNAPSGVAVDSAGNLYIADTFNNRIRRVTAGGIISPIAGNGVAGFSGDGGPAFAASFANPSGVALDTVGNLYVADADNSRLRRVTATGIVTTVAGGGINLGDGGPGVRASLNFPAALALDRPGNLYIADSRNWRVRKVSPAGLITTVAGNGINAFSGDGGPAINASLTFPVSVATDTAGNLYIADQNAFVIRKVSPTGIITTVVGNGGCCFSGDGGPATGAMLNRPGGVAVDAAGNIFVADTINHRVRKVNTAGLISTIAGNGTASFSGDGGLATNATLNTPCCVAVDAAGNLYISDIGNVRVRRVSPSGVISTVAGNGSVGFSGDGGPATAASFSKSLQQGISVDAAGNLLIADLVNNRIRKVTADGIINTVAGDGSFGISGDGGPATQASLSGPHVAVADSSGNLYIADTHSDRVRVVLATAPSFVVTPAALGVSGPSGTETPVTRQVSVTSAVVGLGWNAQVSDPWISVLPEAGTVPGIITVSVDASSLAQGTYRGTITVNAPLAIPTTQTVTMDLTVTTGLAPQLTVEPGSVVIEIAANTGNPPQQTLRISNTGGGGALRWTAQGEIFGGGNWLGVLSTSGSASVRAPGSVPVRVNVAGLQPGIYSGLVHVASQASGQTQDVPVTLLLSQQTKTILTTQTGLRFTAAEGARATGAQSLGIINTGQGTMEWTVRPSTLSGGEWLSVTPSSGQSVAGSVNLATAAVQVNPAGLSAGFYVGELTVNAPGANNAPYRVRVELEVLPAGTSAGVQIRPPQLIFTAQAGTSSPSSQTLRLVTPRKAGVEARGGVLTLEGGNWLQVLPSSLVVSADDPRTVVVQPSLGNLAPGIYRGAVTFQDASETQVVDIIFLVVGTPLGAASRGEAAVCAPQKLIAADRTLGGNFTATAGSGTSLEVQVVDDCANPVADATLVASFSNGDPPVTLASLGNGTYAGTWRPVTAAPQATATIRANASSLATEVRAHGRVQANDKGPALFAGGIVNAASFSPGAALAPGSIVSVFGRNLATSGNAASLPLPRTLGGATLTIGGQDAPLFYGSNGQMNAQLPFEVQTNTRQQVVVRTANTITLPETITIAAARPGIFTLSQDGKGQGAILDTGGRVVNASAPAAAGEVVSVYATGLGSTDPAGSTGQAAGSSLSRVTTPVTAMVGGIPAVVQFAGLAPGFVGLYQVNVQIPAGINAGQSVPLVLFQTGIPSNVVTLSTR